MRTGDENGVSSSSGSSGSMGNEQVRSEPYDGESRESRLKNAARYKKENPQIPYYEAGAKWKIAPSTLQRHVTRKVKNRGGQTVFHPDQEAVFVKHLLMCADALWPITTHQLKDYIERFVTINRSRATRFRNGRPGKDWVSGFLRRHPELKQRRAHAISAAKAWGTTPAKLREFFDRLKPLLKSDGPDYCAPDCILNYDETALGDDAGDPRVITRRSTKTARAVLNNNRANRSIMFAVTGDGTCLAPYVCTKAKFKEDEITAFSPPHCFYGTSKSGWFNMSVFDSWFESVVVPWALSKGDRKRMVIGDNLSAHLSPVTLKRASEVKVFFRLLPPNTTHFMQPLDVSFFSPLKGSWKQQLLDYKRTKLSKTVLKKDFAAEFKKLFATIKKETIISGFKATGLVPFNPEAAVARMPCTRSETPQDQDGSVLVQALSLNQQQRVVTTRRANRLPAGAELAPSPSTSNPEPTEQQQQEQALSPSTSNPEPTEQQQGPVARIVLRRLSTAEIEAALNRSTH